MTTQFSEITGLWPDAIPSVSFSGKQATDNHEVHRRLNSAITELESLVGKERLSAHEETRSTYAKTTLPNSTRPTAVVWPKNVAEVSSILKIAARHKTSWHAISRGKNMGYGDACAPQDGYLIIDTRQMDRIIEINEQLGYAVIEPGVSQGALAAELSHRNSSLMLDVTGAGPDASVVGNILQNGFGHTPYGDRRAHSCNYEYVLPDGSVHRTGFGEVQESNVGHVYPYGSGPNEQGMLAQSSGAVVTRMTIWLMPRPEAIVGFGFKASSLEQAGEILERVSKLKQAGTINGVVHFANDLRVLSSQSWMKEQTGESQVFDRHSREEMQRRSGVKLWNALGGLYGTASEVRAKKRAIAKELRGVCKPLFFGPSHVQLLKTTAKRAPHWKCFERLRHFSTAVGDVYDLLQGNPSSRHLEGVFYRNKPKSGKVLDAGLIWIAPVIPCTNRDATRLISSIEPIANAHGFDLPITISPVVSRAAVCIANISFDKRISDHAKKASACYRDIRTQLSELGYPVYRTSSISI